MALLGAFIRIEWKPQPMYTLFSLTNDYGSGLDEHDHISEDR